MKRFEYLLAGLTTVVFSEIILVLFALGLLLTFPKFLLYFSLVGIGIFIGLVFGRLIENGFIRFSKKSSYKEETPFYEEGTFRDIF